MKKSLIIIFLALASYGHAQEIGYLSGVNRIGISPSRFQPLYGFTIGAQVSKKFAIETALFYSQRSIGETIQADYFSFLLMPKIGYFGKRGAVYYSPGIALNPTLHHSNIENHTYLSHLQSIGGQLNLRPRIMVDIKLGYDIGLTDAYLNNGSLKTYSGPVIFLGLKFKMNDK